MFFGVKSPKIPVLHQHYLPHFGANDHTQTVLKHSTIIDLANGNCVKWGHLKAEKTYCIRLIAAPLLNRAPGN